MSVSIVSGFGNNSEEIVASVNNCIVIFRKTESISYNKDPSRLTGTCQTIIKKNLNMKPYVMSSYHALSSEIYPRCLIYC